MIVDTELILKRLMVVSRGPQFSKPILMFHGTSSKFLRSILKNGLIPNTTEGRWKEDPDAQEIQRSRQSYGGIYFTANLGTAISSASNTVIHQSGRGGWQHRKFNPIYICALLQPQATIPDEDNYKVNISSLKQLSLEYVLIAGKTNITGTYSKQTIDGLNKCIDDLVKQYVPDISVRQDKNVVRSLAKEVIMTEIERVMAYNMTGSYSYNGKIKEALNRLLYKKGGFKWTDPVPKILRIPDKAKAEANARQALDLFIKKTKSNSKKKMNLEPKFVTTRIMTPIKFSGSSRITCIVEKIENENEKENLILHYGIIPEEFKKQYRERTGPLPPIIKAGNRTYGDNSVLPILNKMKVGDLVIRIDKSNSQWNGPARIYSIYNNKKYFMLTFENSTTPKTFAIKDFRLLTNEEKNEIFQKLMK
jgi:hypothetical protein